VTSEKAPVDELAAAPFSADGPGTKISGITGPIRAGRSLEERQKLIERIVASWVEITDQPAGT